MRKLRVLLGAGASLILLAACGSAPAAENREVEDYGSLDELVAAAEEEGSVLVYADLFENDTIALEEAFEKEYPGIDLQIQRLGGTDAITRFEEETEAGAPTADVITVAQADYYPEAIDRGTIVSLRDTGVLEFVPNYPEEYILDDFGTALTQAIEAGFAYNTAKVPADKVPTTWEDLLDPFWKGKVLTLDFDGTNVNQLVTYARVADEYGTDFIADLADQLGAPQGDLVPMHEAIAAGEGGYLTLMSLGFLVEGMKAQGAPVDFAPVPPSYWPIHGFGVSAQAQHPAAARLLAQFMLTPEGGDALNTGPGSFSAYDDMPDSFAPPTLQEIKDAKARKDELVDAFTE